MTARLFLPFSMGRETVVDPVTFETEIDHPILDIGSSYSSVKYPIIEWLVDRYGTNCSTGYDGDAGQYYIDFPSEKDITVFLLRWT
jgi:hypothetical protein